MESFLKNIHFLGSLPAGLHGLSAYIFVPGKPCSVLPKTGASLVALFCQLHIGFRKQRIPLPSLLRRKSGVVTKQSVESKKFSIT